MAKILKIQVNFSLFSWNFPQNLVTLWSKTTKLGGASAIKARFIALGLHELCSQN